MEAVREESSLDSWGDRIEAALCDSDFDKARAAADHARSLAATPRDRVRTALWRARCDYMTCDLEAALPLAIDAARSSKALADVELQACSQTLLARIMRYAGDAEAALDHALRAVRLLEAAGPRQAVPLLRERMKAETALGIVHLSLQNLDAALEFCQRAVHSARELDDQIAVGAGLDTVGCVQGALAERRRSEGRSGEQEHWLREAVRSSAEAMRIARERGHRGNEATALNNLAESLTQLGEAEHAIALLEDWSSSNDEMLPRLRSHHQDTRGSVCLALGRTEEACEWFERSLESADSPVAQVVVLQKLSQALEQRGDWRAALAHHKRYHELHVRLSAESAQRSARVAAVLLETERSNARAEVLARRNEDLQRLSSEDPLTGLANRRRLEELLADGPKKYCIALIDIDHFKQVNDGHSHAVGDEVLRRLASVLRQGCRAGDTPARLGGEEFVMLLRTVAPAEAQAVAERLRLLVADHDWSAVTPGLAVTVSIGMAHPDEAEGGEALLALADQRMYVAKKSGRNRVVCFS